ncbi:type III pantothenate kinase [Chondromyces crocatus]|uniref:Type III pantothenate kinase n=1 Tax=Chondromyces crocatus TaxID=52 RepID=A0A0K1EPM3_CHOCO|nr:type III pantothenate kinase [Chondromyces crocatus]AKT42592.1 pantothenate kinase [Chondromyces crocatus]
MLLAIDVGNTNISFGVFEGDALQHHVRSESARARTADEYAVLVRQMLSLHGVDIERIDSAIIASVVPPLTDTMVGLVRRAFHRDALVVGPGIRTGMPILYENPREVGADRIVNAVAAYEWARAGVIVVDFGTATTFDCVTPRGEYLGGVIAPGIQISAEALFSRAARLHRVEIALPPKVVGRNPMHSMQSGIVYGYAGLVEGICARLRRELAYPCRVVATGGLARLIAPQTESIETVDDDLTLTGLRLLYERNIASREGRHGSEVPPPHPEQDGGTPRSGETT